MMRKGQLISGGFNLPGKGSKFKSPKVWSLAYSERSILVFILSLKWEGQDELHFKSCPGPNWCGSVACALLQCKVAVSIPGQHGPGLWAWSLFGARQEATSWCCSHTLMFLPLSFSFLSLFSQNKQTKMFKNWSGYFISLGHRSCIISDYWDAQMSPLSLIWL